MKSRGRRYLLHNKSFNITYQRPLYYSFLVVVLVLVVVV